MSHRSEFDLIAQFFTHPSQRCDVALGVGDDCALLHPPAGSVLAVTVDTLVAGVHFPEDAYPADIGWKALAVNLSDLAAMGAKPAWITLALTLPVADPAWLAPFAQGLMALAKCHDVALVGGDTTRGPLAITIQALGFCPAGKALRRSGAQPGDGIYVTGTLGDGALGLAVHQGRMMVTDPSQRAYLLQRLHRPEPRLQAGQALRGIASAAIDISDGLVADLGHILQASGVGGGLYVSQLPRYLLTTSTLTESQWLNLILGGGDDYQLCFTVPSEKIDELNLVDLGITYHRIGTVEKELGLRWQGLPDSMIAEKLASGWEILRSAITGYQHF